MTSATRHDLLLDARAVPLGGVRGLTVLRTLPQRGLPTVGPWCFVDHFGPTDQVMKVLPHPHTGLQTVTWPLAGEIRHRDSLGSDLVLRPGELNLMTSGDGVSHSEFSVGDPVPMHGLQLWVALPSSRRLGPAAFEHHPDLPRLEATGWTATVMIGAMTGVVSPATTHSAMLGAEVRVAPGRVTVPLEPTFEHAVLAVDARALVDGHVVEQHQMRYLAPGRPELTLEVLADTTLLLIGGVPFDEDLIMWWNFIGRTHDDIVSARDAWQAGAERFGRVEGHGAQVIPAPPLPDVRLTPRRRSLGDIPSG